MDKEIKNVENIENIEATNTEKNIKKESVEKSIPVKRIVKKEKRTGKVVSIGKATVTLVNKKGEGIRLPLKDLSTNPILGNEIEY